MKPPSSDTKPLVNSTLEASMDLVRAELAEHHALLDDYGLKLPILITRIDEFEKVEDASRYDNLETLFNRVREGCGSAKIYRYLDDCGVVPQSKILTYDPLTIPKV